MKKANLLLYLLLAAPLAAAPVLAKTKSSARPIAGEKGMGAYLMVYHKDATSSLYMATSRDGHTFTDVNDGRPILDGDTIAAQHGVRDPHIYRGPDGCYYMVATDLHVDGKAKGFRTTQWERDDKYGWGNNRGIVLMKSHDLIHWTHREVFINERFPERFGDMGCAWAPQTIYDPTTGRMMIYLTIRATPDGKTRCYYTYANSSFDDLETEPQLLFDYPDPNIQVLDADITPMPDGRFFMTYVAQEQPGGIRYMISDRVNSGYQYTEGQIDNEKRGCEAPQIYKLIGQDKWVMMYDVYSLRPHNFGFMETSDFKTFTPLGYFGKNQGTMRHTNFQEQKHGAVCQISEKEARRLEQYWADQQARQEKKMGAYLMVYHKDADHGIHFALSRDGYSFTALNEDRPVVKGDTIARQRGVRDPHIYRDAEGNFYLAATDLHIYAQREGLRSTEWERPGEKYGWGNNRALVLMKSRDLIHWAHTSVCLDSLDASLREIGCAWAPETTYDTETHRLMVYFTMRQGTAQASLYYAYVNPDFNRFTSLPKPLFTYPKPGITAIDGDICWGNGQYHLFYVAHDGTPGIKQATSSSITGPWTYDDRFCDEESVSCEAPHVYKLIGQKKWMLMTDVYGQKKHNFGFYATTDFSHFTNLGHFGDAESPMRHTNFEEQKHGAVCWLTQEEARRLEQYWKKNRR